MRGQKFRQQRRQKLGHRGGIGQHAHMTARAIHIFGQVTAQIGQLLQHQPRVMHESLAGWRERHALTGAIQELDAQTLFKIFDTNGCCRQRHVRALCTARQAVGLGDVNEETNVRKIKMRSHRILYIKSGKVVNWPDSSDLLSA